MGVSYSLKKGTTCRRYNSCIFVQDLFCFSEIRSRSRPKISAPAPAKILNQLRLQPKILGSDRLRLCNTAFYSRTECLCRRHIKIPQHVEVMHNTFEVADLQKLIKKTTNDLEVRQSADFTTCVCFLSAKAHCFVKK